MKTEINKYWNNTELHHNAALLEIYKNEKCDCLLRELLLIKSSPEKFPSVKITRINHENTFFNSYEFNFEKKEKQLINFQEAFDFLLSVYTKNGFKSPWETVEACHTIGKDSEFFLNPLVFEYSIPSNFDWHMHMPFFQKFQLVMNLTKSGRDYKSALFEVIKNKDKSWKLTENHLQGQIFSFPYGNPHRVTDIEGIKNAVTPQRYVHLLMPIHPKGGFDGAFKALPKLNNNNYPKTLEIKNFYY